MLNNPDLESGRQVTPRRFRAGPGNLLLPRIKAYDPARVAHTPRRRQGQRSCATANIQYLLSADEHSPASVRAVQPARNMDEFYVAFGIKPGDPEYLAPDDRILIW